MHPQITLHKTCPDVLYGFFTEAADHSGQAVFPLCCYSFPYNIFFFYCTNNSDSITVKIVLSILLIT